MDDGQDKVESAADDVIAQLRDEGELHSEGRFTMDRETARKKLSEFQLPDPTWSLLLIVRCAVRRGATELDIEVDADDLRFTFDGPPFDAQDFEHLYQDLLSDSADPHDAGRSELGLGLNAALGLEPRYVRVRSGDGAVGAELELKPGKPDQYGPCKEPIEGTTVHIKLGKGVLSRAMEGLGEELPEVALIAERCQYAEIPIRVNGERVSHGLQLSDVVCQAPVEAAGLKGTAALWQDLDEAPGVRVVKHGVWIADLPAEPTPEALVVVICANDARTDLTSFGLVEDEGHAALMKSADQGWRATVRLALKRHENLASNSSSQVAEELKRYQRVLREAMQRFDDVGDYRGKTKDPLARLLSKCPVWPTARTASDEGKHQSLRWLMSKANPRDKLAYLDHSVEHGSADWLREVLPNLHVTCVIVDTDEDAALLEQLLEKRVVYLSEHPQAKRYFGGGAPKKPRTKLTSQRVVLWLIVAAILAVVGAGALSSILADCT